MKKVLTLVIATACTIVAYGGNTSEVGGSSAAHNDDSDLRALSERVERLEQLLREQQVSLDSMHVDAYSGATIPRSNPPAPADTVVKTDTVNAVAASPKKGRLTIGGYGEATMKRCFYSNNYLRYISPEQYANDGYGELDLPHVVIYLGYDFGHGWSMGSEIEFEHGGSEVAVEIEEEEGGEYETEVERGGEVALEQFWLQKSFNPYANLRAGMIIVPLGGVNAHHEPNQFFGVYRQEGDNTILPCTWHDIGLQFHGRYKWLGYTAQFLPGLESTLFSSKNWIQGGSASPYEFKLANCYAGLLRLDFYPLQGQRSKDKGQKKKHDSSLRISLSGYAGTSFRQNLTATTNKKYEDVKGLVALGALDWAYTGHGVIFRGSATYGHLGDADRITAFNKSMSKNSVSKRQNVASDAYCAGAEIGYDVLFEHYRRHANERRHQLYVFARYDIYDAQARIDASRNYWAGRQKFTCGLNYMPIPEVVIKGEFGYGLLNQNPNSSSRYNNEPYVALGINYCGFFRL